MINTYTIYDLKTRNRSIVDFTPKDLIEHLYANKIITKDVIIKHMPNGHSEDIIHIEVRPKYISLLNTHGYLCLNGLGDDLTFPCPGSKTRYIIVEKTREGNVSEIVKHKIKYGNFRSLKIEKLLEEFNREDNEK